MKNSKANTFKQVVYYTTYLFIVWGFYRLLLTFPENFEVFVVKPIFWLIPLWFVVKKSKLNLKDLGVTGSNLFPAIYMGIALGSIFAFEAVAANYVKYNGLNFGANVGGDFMRAFLFTVATAVVEEITFRGYIFGRALAILQSEWVSNLIVSVIWTAIHVPIAIFDWHLSLLAAASYLFVVFIFSIGASFLYARTKNIASPIILHVLWQWPVILFR